MIYKIILSLIFSSFVISCYHRYPIMSAESLSMTKTDSKTLDIDIQEDEVSSTWCQGDTLIKDDGTKFVGLADQVVLKAHKEHAADFFVESTIYLDSNSCAIIEGRAAKIKK